MVLFNCTTCSSQLEDPEMLKHLSLTRHKTLVHVPSQATLECDQCQDSNIHQLVIIRYGGSDIEMLCQTCLSKERGDKPSTQYTEQNGAILKYFERYLRVAELECGLCGSESNLAIDVNNTNFVACAKCIREGGLEADHRFLRESADNFLYVYLGIKETVKPNEKVVTRSRKVGRGRKGGKGKGGKGKPNGGKPNGGKPSATSKVMIPTENVESLRSFKSLSSAELAKIKPQDELKVKQQRKIDVAKMASTRSPTPSKSNNKNNNNSNNNKTVSNGCSSKNQSRSSTPRPASHGQNSSTPKPQAKAKVQAQAQESSSIQKTTQSKSATPVPVVAGSQVSTDTKKDNNDSNKRSKKSKEPQESSKKTESKQTESKKDESSIKPTDSKELKDKKAKKIDSKKNDKKNDVEESKQQQKKKKQTTTTDRSVKQDTKKQTDRNIARSSPSSTGSVTVSTDKATNPRDNRQGKDNKDTKKDTDKTKKKPNQQQQQQRQQRQQPEAEEPEVEEFEHIPKYQSKQPKLRYDNMSQYFTEMCNHLFLEQKLDVSPLTKYYPDWTTDRSVFKITVPNDEDIQRLVPEKLRSLGKSPFQINQGVFITRDGDNDHVWSAFIRDLAPVTKHKRSKTVVEYDILLELFKWNDAMSFPYGSGNLRITPCSVPISRVLLAMARLDNKSFINMLLGQQQIKQLYFNNRLQFSSDSLNDSQKVAIEHVLNNSITVLQGPPGTGKTSTIYEIIIQLIRNLHTFPIMVVAASNVAVDNIAEKLKTHKDLKTLRITSQEKEREYNESHPLADICLHHQVEAHLPQNIKDIGRSLRYGEKISATAYKKYLTAKISTVDRLVAQAQIILTTTVTAGGLALKNVAKVPVVIMDEATQSNEASSLIPLSIPGVTKFLFVGDQRQLSSFSDVPYLEQSLFERVLLNQTYKTPHMLNTQYRMHPEISAFPIAEFYEGQLLNGVTAEQKQLEAVEPLQFIDHAGKHAESRVRNRGFNNGATYVNHGEVSIIVSLIKQLVFSVSGNVSMDKISIITPYSAQRDLLANRIQADLDLNPQGESIAEEINDDESGGALTRKRPSTVKTIRGIMISSIDAFQGREQEIVIFSCVRSNPLGNIGFVRDRRRLNVALTRAKKSLILVGDEKCLSRGDLLWTKFMKYLGDKNKIVSVTNHEEGPSVFLNI